MNFAISYNHQWIVKNVRNFCKIIQKNEITFLTDDSYFSNIQVFKIFSKENIKLKMVKKFNNNLSEEFLVTSYHSDCMFKIFYQYFAIIDAIPLLSELYHYKHIDWTSIS